MRLIDFMIFRDVWMSRYECVHVCVCVCACLCVCVCMCVCVCVCVDKSIVCSTSLVKGQVRDSGLYR